MLDETLSIAPMMEWTDCHFRYFVRGLTKRTVLYTEMVVDDTINHNPNLDFIIGKNIEEQPSVIQLGGHNPETLAQAAEICSQYGGSYDEINLNCGCPSQRVSQRCFGAKLMTEPDLVREIVSQMSRKTHQTVTVKCRLGVDSKDSYEDLCNFIGTCHLGKLVVIIVKNISYNHVFLSGGVKKFIIHSRKCFLKGLSTKQNRDIPPLRYDVTHRLVKEFPDLTFVLNGGIMTLEDAKRHISSPWPVNTSEEQLPAVHGVMIGRAAYNNPLLLATADSTFFGCKNPNVTRRELLERYIKYCEFSQSEDGPKKLTTKKSLISASTSVLLKPVHNVMNGLKNVAKYKQELNDIYVAIVKQGIPNPSCRDVVSKISCRQIMNKDLT